MRKPSKTTKFRRLFFDIEVSPNLVFSWRIGNKIPLNYDNIISERAIICICYKWEGESQVHSLTWNRGNDKQMLVKFMKVMEEATESVAHNGDKFDEKWLRTRCIYHKIPAFPKYTTTDTLKLARGGFNFNSNRLDYIARYLGEDGKHDHGGLDTWKNIVLRNSKSDLDHMVKYCKQDVRTLEKVFKRFIPYTTHKVHAGVVDGLNSTSCPECGGFHFQNRGLLITASGTKKQRRQCQDCGKYSTTSIKRK